MKDPMWPQEDIFHWAKEQFGVDDPQTVALRMLKEMAELVNALHNGKFREAREECADIYIFLAQIHFLLSGWDWSLQDDVDVKMAINEKREWETASDGSIQHKKGTR